MNELEIYKALRKKFENPSAWIQNAYALDAFDNEVDSDDKNACRWCMLGGYRSLNEGNETMTVRQNMSTFLSLTPNCNIVEFNDNNTYEEVMAVLDKAIKIKEEEAA